MTVMFWRKDKAGDQSAVADAQAPLDATIEADRIAKLTGGRPVVIERKAESKIKLPGL